MTYASLSIVKQRLRVEDTTLDDELEGYVDEIDSYMNRKLRDKIGYKNEYGDDVVLPLTENTIPTITFELNTIANDLVVGKFRFETTNDETPWIHARKELEEYLDEEFGWSESGSLKMKPDISFTPTSGNAGATVTISGSQFGIRNKLKVYFDGEEMTTSPDPLVSDDTGAFTSTTFTIPSGQSSGTYEVKVEGVMPTNWKKHGLKTGLARHRFRVT